MAQLEAFPKIIAGERELKDLRDELQQILDGVSE